MACGDKSEVLQSTGVTSAPTAGGAAPDRYPYTHTQKSVSVLTAVGLWAVQRDFTRCDPSWCSCKDISRAIADGFLVFPFKGETCTFCG